MLAIQRWRAGPGRIEKPEAAGIPFTGNQEGVTAKCASCDLSRFDSENVVVSLGAGRKKVWSLELEQRPAAIGEILFGLSGISLNGAIHVQWSVYLSIDCVGRPCSVK